MPSTESLGPSLPGNYLQRYGKNILARILKVGPIPAHVAFVMDGNRRFAKRNHEEAREGHNAGFESLSHILELCYNTGVKVVTVFAFSIENFNRTPYEVDSLMEITKSRLLQIIERGDIAEQYGISIRVLGDRKLLRDDIVEVIEKATKMTENNTKAILNICFPYTSRDDITMSIKDIVNSVQKGGVDPSDIDENMLESKMYFGGNPPLDILVRTSGVERFSDFMLWQANKGTMIEFVPTLWPEFTPFQMFMIILKWGFQRQMNSEKDI